jgi:hypothetical protein
MGGGTTRRWRRALGSPTNWHKPKSLAGGGELRLPIMPSKGIVGGKLKLKGHGVDKKCVPFGLDCLKLQQVR